MIAALLAVGLAPASGRAAVPPPLGDQTAIGYYHDRAAAYGKIAGAKIVETGYFFVRAGSGTAVDYAWGNGRPAGYTPATGTIVARLVKGKIVAYLARLHAPGIRPVRVLMAWGHVYSSTENCWRKTPPSASPLGTGDTYVMNDGGARFEPLRRSGPKTATKFTYAWVRGATATETSVFGPRDPSPFDVTIAVKGTEKMSIRKSVTPLKTPPPLPVPSPPGEPVPKPLCA